MGSHSPDPAPLGGWFFSFPGLHVSPPFNMTNPDGRIPSPPTNSSYDRLILTQGGALPTHFRLPATVSSSRMHQLQASVTHWCVVGGDTTWGDSFYKTLEAELPSYKPAGWDGVCWVSGTCEHE